MADEFNMGLRSQHEWSWLLAIDLFLGGLGGGLFLLYRALSLPPWIGFLSLILVLAGGAVLISELGRPWRAWRAIFRPQTSWISRGVLCIALFALTAVLSLSPVAFPSISWVSGSVNENMVRVSGWIASLCALFITLYPGFVLGASRSVPFWDTPLLPLVFVMQALLGGSGVLLLLSAFGLLAGMLPSIQLLSALLIAVNFVAILVYLATIGRTGVSAAESVRLFKHGGLARLFGAGAVLLGMILPLLLVALSTSAFLAGAGILCGGLLFRYCILKAGVYVPSALVGLDLSGFKGNRPDFVLEYANWTVSGHGGSVRK